ncbi:MAG: RimK family alpha-L-glutamate ligase [Planctomycetota bacterium]
MRIGLVTCAELPEPDPDAPRLHAALAARGHEPELVPWDGEGDRLASFDLLLLRSPWNYYRAHERFLAWVDHAAHVAQLVNPPDVVRWNLHKGYLLELASRGVPIVPSRVVARGSADGVREVLEDAGWHDVVVKPCISAASWRTRCFLQGQTDEAARYARLLAVDGDVLVQPFQPGAVDPGERSLIWIDGAITHAIRKRPRFDGQDEAVTADAPPTSDERALVARILAPFAERIAYARIDLFPTARGGPLVSEVELVEPSLFFRYGPEALPRLIRGLERCRAAGA